jgi:hypothetical protein
VGVDRTLGGAEEDGGVARVADGDVGFESGSSTRFFDDMRGGVKWQEVNPAKAEAGWLAGVVEPLLADKIRRKDVDGLSSRVLNGEAWTTGSEQVLKPDRHIGRGGVEAGTPSGGLSGGAGPFVAGADEKMAALLSIGKESRVPHVERAESALGKKGGVLLVRGGLEGVAEEVESKIRVDGGATGSAAETLVWQPAPAGAIVGEGEGRRPWRGIAQFSWEAGCVCRKIRERDGHGAFGHKRAGWSKALERIVEPHGLVRDEFGEDVSGKDFCERAEPQQRLLGGKLMGVGRGLAVSAEKYLMVANDDENHAGGTGLKEEICAESASRLEVEERCWGRRLGEGRHERKHEQEGKQCAQVSLVHFLIASLKGTQPRSSLGLLRYRYAGVSVLPQPKPAAELHCLGKASRPLTDSDRVDGAGQARAAADSFSLNYIERARASSTILSIMPVYE